MPKGIKLGAVIKNDKDVYMPEKNLVIQHFKDDATAFNNQKKATVEGKGVLNNRISEHILQNLNQVGIKTHLIKRLNMREQLIKLVEIIPIELDLNKEEHIKAAANKINSSSWSWVICF